jgi:hypothetical protein
MTQINLLGTSFLASAFHISMFSVLTVLNYINAHFSFFRTDSEVLGTATTLPPDKAGTDKLLFKFL